MIPMLYSTLLRTLLSTFLFLVSSRAAPTDVPSAASFYVSHIPELHQNLSRPLRIWAGHLSSDPDLATEPNNAVTPHLYFFMVKARRTADKERVMFWFNGGPGCSSFDGLMMEVGPWRVDGKGGLKTIEGGWEEYTTMVYIDQPAGTGFSYTSSNHYLHELPEASRHWVQFLQNFYRVFPEYKSMDTYLGGESYAGQYIPYFADAMLNHQDLHGVLKGVAIGNGWIDAKTQYPAYLDYAVKHGITEANSDDWKRGKEITEKCVADIATYKDIVPVHTDTCETVMLTVIQHKRKEVKGVMRCMNIYDIRLDDVVPACGMNWPPDLVDIGTYLKRPDVVRAIHATAAPNSWTECRGKIHQAFTTKHSNSSITVLPKVLEKIPVMLFAGDQDLICNYVGMENMMQAMTWNGATGLGTVQTHSWLVNGTHAGTWVNSRNLTYVKIFNASHMAGYDVPHVTHDMILRFMGMNFSAITDGTARIPSKVGEEVKPIPTVLKASATPTAPVAKSPEQDKAMWEAYYNAGSAAIVLVLIALMVGGFVWWRSRRGGLRGLPLSTAEVGNEEETIPLTLSGGNDDDGGYRQRSTGIVIRDGSGKGKGKERAMEFTPKEEIFGVGELDDEDRTPAYEGEGVGGRH